jgi:hypothetical protein
VLFNRLPAFSSGIIDLSASRRKHASESIRLQPA